MRYLHNEYDPTRHTFTVARWFKNILAITGATACVVVAGFAWGYFYG